jgi:hypothetical protein
VTARDALELAGFAVTIGGIIFHAGKTSERFAQSERQTKAWADGLGGLFRASNTRNERRWMLQLADDVELAETQEKRTRIATRIREEVWRCQ